MANTLDKYRAKYQKAYTSAQAAPGQAAPAKKQGTLDKYRQRYNKVYQQDATANISTRLQQYSDNYKKFSEESSAESAKTGYSTVRAQQESRAKAASALRDEAEGLRTYIYANKRFMSQEDYDSAIDFITQSGYDVNSVMDWFDQTARYYSQWDTEEDYTRWEKYHGKSYGELYAMLEDMEDGDEKDWLSQLAASVDYDEKRNLDVTAAEKEISDLEFTLEEYRSLTRWMTDEEGEARAEAIRQQYGGEDEIKALIQKKKQYLNQAKYIQEGIALSAVANNADFAENSGYVGTKIDDAWGRLTSQYGMGFGDLTYEYINNQNGARDEIKRKARFYSSDGSAVDSSSFEEKGYDYMTEDEVAIYNYHYAKGGKEAAQKYLDSIQETLNHRKAAGMYTQMEGRTLLEMTFGVAAGLDQFRSGMTGAMQAITGEADYIPQSATQMASGMVREDLGDVGGRLPGWLGGGSVGQMGYDAITTTANMAPSILSSMAANMIVPGSGAVVGNATMFASSAGNAYQEALNYGYDKNQARAYSTLVGASEAGLQYLLGGISSMGGKLSGGTITKMLDGVDDAFLRAAGKLGGSMLSEGTEEGLQEILTPLFKSWTLMADEDVDWSEVAYSSLLGALTGGVFEGGNIAIDKMNNKDGSAKVDVPEEQPAGMDKPILAETSAPASLTNAGQTAEVQEGNLPTGEKAAPAAVQAASEESRSGDAALEEASRKYGAQAGAMVSVYNEGQDVESFDAAYQIAYDMGRSGVSQEYAVNNQATSYLTESQRVRAWIIGRDAARAEAKKQQNQVSAGEVTNWRKGTVKGYDVSIDDLSKAFNVNQDRAYKVMSTLAEATGVDIVLYKSQVNEETGKLVGQVIDGVDLRNVNGAFVWNKDKIYIDVNAGVVNQTEMGDVTKYTMLRTFTHEFTHFAEKWSPEQYGEFRSAVFEAMTARGENVDDLITAEMAWDESLSYEAASREVIADAMTDILQDSTFVEQLSRKHENVFRKMLEKLKAFAKRIRDYFKSVNKSQDAGIKALQKEVEGGVRYLEDIVRMFDSMAVDAVENYQGRKNTAEIGGEVKHSFKGYAADGKGIYESNFPTGTPKKAKGERILKYIQDVWSKKPITLRVEDANGIRYIEAKFDPTFSEDKNVRTDASKLMGGNRHGSSAEQRVTLDLADDYYQIASESTYNYSKDETGKVTDPHKNVRRWHYFVNDIYFAEYGSDVLTPYRVSINVKEKADGHFFYSFSAEKTEGTSTQRTLHAAVNGSNDATANGSSSKNSIRNADGKVNQKNSDPGAQNQQRRGTLSDWEVLSKASEQMDTEKLTDGERDALRIFNKHLAELRKAEEQRREQGRLWHQHQFDENGDRREAQKARNRMDILDRRIQSERERLLSIEDKAVLQAVLQKAREVVEQQEQSVGKERLENFRKNGIESRNKTAMRRKIQNVVGELNTLLLSNDKKRHVPDSLKKAVADALALVNMDTVGAEERAAKYAALIARETDPDKIDAYTVTMENILRQGEKMGQRLKELRDAYEEIRESNDPDIANAYDHVIAGSLKELSRSIGNTSLRNMSVEQLQDVYDMYRMVLIRVRDANKSFLNEKKESISDLASRVVGEVRMVGGEHKHRAAVLDSVKEFGWNNMKPVYAFERIGSETLKTLFEGVRSGEDVWAKDMTEAREYYLDKSRKYGYDSWDFERKHRFESDSGLEFELTLEQILSLYAYSKREKAHDHLRLGGFVFDSNIETYKDKGSKLIKYKVNTADAHQITPEILAGIIGKLSGEQMAFVDEMQEYLSTTMGGKGNEVSMQMYGVKLFKEKFYFPLKSAKQFMFEQNEVSGEVKIKNSGFTKKTVPEANNPVVLSNFMDVWSNHVNDMSMYHAFVLPLEDFNRIFNYNSPKREGRPPVSVKGTIQSAYSPAAVSYLKNLITDLNGGAISDPRENLAKSMMGKFKKAAVFASASVVFQQPSAIGRAFALIDPKHFIGARVDKKRHKVLWAELKQYAPVAIIKEMGYFDTGMGKSAQDFITGDEHDSLWEKTKALFVGAETIGGWASTARENTKDFVVNADYRDEVLSRAPALADELTWCAIWDAVKRETKEKRKDLKVGSEEFLQAAGKRFTEVVSKTQVYDSVLSRSANMRSKSVFMNMWTAFMAEPTTSVNMMEDALRKAKKGNGKYAARVTGAVLASVLLNSLLVSIVYAARDDDEDETFVEKYFQSLVTEMMDGINPITYYPFLKDVWSALQGFDVERSDMSLITKLAETGTKFVQLSSKDVSRMDEEELEKHMKQVKDNLWSMVDHIGSLAGLPIKNIRRDVLAAKNFVKTVEADKTRETTLGSLADKVGTSAKNTIPVIGWESDETKADKLYKATVNGDAAYVKRINASYQTEAALKSAIRKGLRDNDIRITEAAMAFCEEDFEHYADLFEEIRDEGIFAHNDIYSAIQSKVNELDNANTPEESGAETGDEEHMLFNAENYYDALLNNDSGSINMIYSILVSKEQAEGYLLHEAKDNIATALTAQVKRAYMAGEIAREKALEMLTDHTNSDESTIKKWEFEMEYGYTWGAKNRAYRLGKISESELVSSYMDIEGASRGDAEAYVQFLDLEMANSDVSISANDAAGYFEYAKPAGIDIDTYLEYSSRKSQCVSDKDENGNTIQDSKKSKVLAVIHSLQISREQKDALYYAAGYAESEIDDAPWR